jgi:hypothetical protein
MGGPDYASQGVNDCSRERFSQVRATRCPEAPKHLAPTVHDLYFEPQYEEFQSRTIWSLSHAFTSAFKDLEPIPQFKATAKLVEFSETRFSRPF